MDASKVSKKRKFKEIDRKKFQRILNKEKIEINAKINARENGRTSNPMNNFIREEVENDETLNDKLRDWAVNHNITTIAIRDLLVILSFGFVFLPKDPRTLMKTPKKIHIENRANGQMWYLGIKSNLCKLFRTLNKNLNLNLNFHFDGVQIYKSATKRFWPILAQIHG